MQFIYIIRHGETDANVNEKINDKNVITPLNSTGRKQATVTGKYLKKYRFTQDDCKNIIFYSSPSIRAIETAKLIKAELKISNDIIEDDRISEFDNGLLSGMTKGDKIYKTYMKEYNKLPIKDPVGVKLEFNKFNELMSKQFKYETIVNIKKRILSFMKSLPNTKNIIVVTHSGTTQGIIQNLFNIDDKIMGDISNGKNCTIACIVKYKKKI